MISMNFSVLQVTTVLGSPYLIYILSEVSEIEQYDLSSVISVISSGAPLLPSTAATFEAKVG